MKNLESNGRIITCILPKGKALAVLQALFDKGVTRANFAFARGFDIQDLENPKTGIPDAVEKEIVSVIAKDQQEGEELFNTIFALGNINQLGGGIMYMSKLHKSSVYELPDIQEKMEDAQQTAGL